MARLGQNFLADPNLLEAIVRSAGLAGDEVVLEVGGGEGVLTERLAEHAAHVHLIELDRNLAPYLEPVAERAGNVAIVWGDAMRIDLHALDPAPTAMVANLPYSIATPLILRTIAELPSLERWTLMVQREIADRLRAGPGTKLYGSPSVVAQLACDVEFLRPVGRSVFSPRPRVDSALIALRRRGPAAPADLVRLVRGAFAHRRKTLAASLELAGVAKRPEARAALEALGLDPASRAEALAPGEFGELGRQLAGAEPGT
ncbi:ribosomal RNA small subunit methyltransferase A [Thermoleophilia bacterium SCSIO 60948]|nr:ribosomal RNA small subunit methyltransferase A [Thermoleophilia bacterium SCSIO 60948]